MGSSLRARLNAMKSSDVQKSVPLARSGLRSIKRESVMDRAFVASPGKNALNRLGVAFPWPQAEEILFLDTETTGLQGGAGTLAFLIGLGYFQDDTFITEQYIIGDYSDEAELYARVIARIKEFSALVTFNGRAFDVPMMKTRLVMLRMNDAISMLDQFNHIDLLLPSRRLWKKRLHSVKLSILEEKILRQGRTDDLPGSEAPKRFFQYLKCADATLLDPVIEHNAQDIRSMPQVLFELMGAYSLSGKLREADDQFSMGRTLEKQGERTEAIRLYHMASLPRAVTTISALRSKRVASEALYALGMLYKRLGDHAHAVESFQTLVSRDQMGVKPMIELAKYYEHKARDFETALGWTQCAIATEEDPLLQSAFHKRKARLEKKINRTGCDEDGI